MGALLESIQSPADIKRLNYAQLAELAEEIRVFLIQSLSKTGGHLGPNLGVVAGDQLKEPHDGALVNRAEHEGRGRCQQAVLVSCKANEALREIIGAGLLDLPDVEIDEAHCEHVIGEEGELVFAVRVVRLEGVPKELDVFLLLRRLEGEGEVAGEFGGFFHNLGTRAGGLFCAPDAGNGGLDFLLEARHQFAVGGDERLLRFDLGDDRLLCSEGWEGHV